MFTAIQSHQLAMRDKSKALYIPVKPLQYVFSYLLFIEAHVAYKKTHFVCKEKLLADALLFR